MCTASATPETDKTLSVDPGSIASEAFKRAPEASWISLILEPPLPMTEPMRELGMINLMVTAREPGTEGTSNGSSLIRRTMRPKALATASRGPETLRIRSGLPGMDSETVTRALDFSYKSISTGSDVSLAKTTHPNLVDVSTTTADDDTCVLSNNKRSHRDLLRSGVGFSRSCGFGGRCGLW